MRKIKDIALLKKYVQQYDLQSYMNTDLLTIAELRSFGKGEKIIQIEKQADYLYFLVEGKAMVYAHSSNTEDLNISYIQAMCLLGEASTLWEIPQKANVRAISPCICVSIYLGEHRQLLQNDVLFLQNVCKILSLRLNYGMNLANSLKEPVEVRLAKFLLANSSDNELSFSLTTCAKLLNVSYRHLLRTMTGFCKNGLVEKRKSTYIICNREALLDLANKVA